MAAMKLLSLFGTAALVSATSSTSTSSSLPITSRTLEDESGSSYAYLDDVSNYSIQYSKCVRVKIPNENEDDAVEGNTNFYNGRYHAQYMRYATFHLCSNDGDKCSCDYSVEYATEMEQYLGATMGYLDEYCANGGDCNNYNKGGGNDADESQYLNCAAAYEDGDGVQYYYAPQCDDDSGGLVIGVFYDNECTIKTKNSAPNFNYYKFETVTGMCMGCNGDNTCNNLYQESFHCLDGKEASGQQNDEMSVCSAVKKATTSHDYSSVKKRHSGADAFLKVFFSVLFLSFIGAFVFLTYTYYIRHRDGKNPLVSSDHLGEHEEGGVPTSSATLI
ncbi:predicted protein [Thalassiosira pseudonana CCMP1335]|uniref:Uncharacterized protein n=1 Tax=Thalassiosira pseudonana TaxID=35128 RepID=B8C0C2_THAPS|nr:predicted protein [Thalassiosira pseudonana CCMP1335]EED93494.1 predicted protein [Thalassiosira pseudonana CCMP1335]